MIDMAVSHSLTARLAAGVRSGKRAAGRDGHERTRTVPMRLGKRAALALLGRRNNVRAPRRWAWPVRAVKRSQPTEIVGRTIIGAVGA